ncbi:holo-ACP synthase [Pelagibacteraceae bacterium]|jgi:holo-[acyl-carrier protein] synthase|nr:holo-ACP synthase [Pelagibacteraceae bacterium]
MKIYGIGTDIVSVDRIKKLQKNKTFLEKIFSKEEVSKCSRLINSKNCYAKRFAAKEAFAKALGTGISYGINFNEIIVMNEKNGRPFIKITGKTMKIIKKKFKKKIVIALSLSDEKKYAIAFVTISL